MYRKEEVFSTVFKNSPVGIVIVDSDTKLVAANDYMFKIFHISPREYIGRKFGNVFNCSVVAGTDYQCGAHEECSICELRKGVMYVLESKNAIVDAELDHLFTIEESDVKKWFNVNACPVEIDGEEHAVIILADNTENKLLEQILIASEEKYRLLFENMTQGFALHEIITDDNGKPINYRYLEVNDSFEKLTGASPDIVVGKTIKDIMPETEQYWIDIFGRVALTGEPCSYTNYSKEIGKYFDTWIFSPKPRQFAVVFSDVTDREEGKQNLERREKMLHAISEATKELLLNRDYIDAISKSLVWLGEATGVDRVYLFENKCDGNGKDCTTSQRFEWNSGEAEPQIDNPDLQDIPFNDVNEFVTPLLNGKEFVAIIEEMKDCGVKELLQSQKILSILVLPIFVDEKFWGFVGFDECKYERVWAESEFAILQSFAGSVSKAIERKQHEERIEYLSRHDSLTGLFNRQYIHEELRKIDKQCNLPISIIIGDINGLKIVNDAFGHAMGNELIKKCAKIFKDECREDDIIARWGGDEFIVLMPKTSSVEAEEIVKQTRSACVDEQAGTAILSISLGWETKTQIDESIDKVLKSAEDYMYRNKIYESESFHGKTISLILNTLNEKNKREEQHSRRVSEICVHIGRAMGFSDSDINKLRAIGLVHDIGKIAISEEILNKQGELTEDELLEMHKHPEIGYRILSTTYETSELAQHVLSHHERLDGRGYPKGVKGEQISVMTRILTIADAYDAMTSNRTYRNAMTHEKAIEELIKNAGTQFDSEIVEVFSLSELPINGNGGGRAFPNYI